MNQEKIDALKVIKQYGHFEEYELPDGLGNDEKFMLVAIGKDSDCILWIGKELYKNKEFLHTILIISDERFIEAFDPSDDPDPFFEGPRTPFYASLIYKSMSEEFKADPDIIIELLNRKLKVTELHESLLGNSEFFTKAVKYDPELFHFADDLLKNNVDFIRAVVAVNPTIWKYLTDEQKLDENIKESLGDIKTRILKIEVGDDDELIRYCDLVPDEIKLDKEFALRILSKNYRYLYCASDSLKDDLEVVRTAYQCIDSRSWYGNAKLWIEKQVSPRIQSILDKSTLVPLETLTQAIEKQNLFGNLNVKLKLKDEGKLTPQQRKDQSGPSI